VDVSSPSGVGTPKQANADLANDRMLASEYPSSLNKPLDEVRLNDYDIAGLSINYPLVDYGRQPKDKLEVKSRVAPEIVANPGQCRPKRAVTENLDLGSVYSCRSDKDSRQQDRKSGPNAIAHGRHQSFSSSETNLNNSTSISREYRSD
jgi:hypothetical protein